MELAGTLLAALLATLPQDPAKPQGEAPRVEWQRSLADALAVQKATGLPLLIAVNMDGEVFNERFANDVYRDPQFVALTRGYVCVVASLDRSPDRHSERDYDAFGNRVECSRFPGCTCSEHINIEPALFERWLKPTRNAPRHVGVGADGKVLFDRFLDQSMQTAIDAIRRHRGQPQDGEPPASVEALLARHDAAARRALEPRDRCGDAAGRRSVLAAAAAAKNQPFDLLRMALREDDDVLFTLAAKALANVATKDATIDVEDALARCSDPAVTKLLLERHAAIGADDQATARISRHLAVAGTELPAGVPWSGPWRATAFDAGDRAAVEAELDRCEARLRTSADDEETRLALAIAQQALGDILVRDGGRNAQFWFDDAVANARKIRGAPLQAEVQAIIAYGSHMLGDGTAAARAIGQAMGETARQPDPWLAARALEMKLLATCNPILADTQNAGTRDLSAAIGTVNGALNLLTARGGGREGPQLAAIALLELAGCRAAARARLAAAATSFPASPAVHDHWRARLMMDLGAAAMHRTYARYADAAVDQPTAQWFAGLAALVAAEQHMRDQRPAEATAAYGDSLDRFGKSAEANADFADSAHHYMVLALAGRAELLAAAGKAEAAVDDLLRAAKVREASLDESDGLQRKPRAIAGGVAQALRKEGKPELADRLQPILP